MAVDIRAAASGDVSLFVTLRLNYLAYARETLLQTSGQAGLINRCQ